MSSVQYSKSQSKHMNFGNSWKTLFFTSQGLSSTSELKIYLPTDVRYITQIQLIGYQLEGLNTGPYALVLNEHSAGVHMALSNHNTFTDILYPLLVPTTGTTTNVVETTGLITHKFSPHNMPTMTLEVRQADGSKVSFGTGESKHAHFLIRVCHGCGISE
jgi:hypothetical protein